MNFDDITPEDYSKLSNHDLGIARRRRILRAEWESTSGKTGSMIVQLRKRSADASNKAALMLASLIIIGLFGVWLLVGSFDVFGLNKKTEEAQANIFARASVAQVRTLTNNLDTKTTAFKGLIQNQTPPQISSGLYDVAFDADGDALVVGKDSTILLRRDGSNQFDALFPNAPDVWINDVEFASSGLAYLLGRDGLILTYDKQQNHFEDYSIANEKGYFNDIRFAPDNSAFVISNGGRIMRQPSPGTAFVDETPDPSNRYLVTMEVSDDGEVIAVGHKGALLVRDPQSGQWDDLTLGNEDLYGIDFDENQVPYITGQGGTIIWRNPETNKFEKMASTELPFRLLDIEFSAQGHGVIVGDKGSILLRAPDQQAFERTEAKTENDLYDVAIAPSGLIVAQGARGEIMVKASDWETFESARTPIYPASLFHIRIGPEGQVVIPGADGALLAVKDADDLKEAPDAAKEILEIGAELKKDQEVLESDYLTDRKIQVGQAFLRDCLRTASQYPSQTEVPGAEAAPADSRNDLPHCIQAYTAIQNGGSGDIYLHMADRLTPAVLVLVLISTLGAGYRYNTRLANFLASRADALELAMLNGLQQDRFDAFVASTAAERTPFVEPKTPVDAVVDIAKETMSKLPKGSK